MSKTTKSVIAYIAAIPTVAGIAFFLLNSVFETREAHSEDVRSLRVETRESMRQSIQQVEESHQREYERTMCLLRAIREEIAGGRGELCP